MEADDPIGVGSGESWRRLRAQVRALAPLRVPVWIEGEPGSGRRAVASALHRLGAVEDRRFAALRDPARLESGGLEKAGTIYLEAGESLGRAEVARLLAWLQRRPEASRPRLLVAASPRAGHRPSPAEEELGRFRIGVPALRERSEDLPELARFLLDRIGARIGRAPRRVDGEAMALLRARRWKGNLRELEAVLEQALAFSLDGEITREGVERATGGATPIVAVERQRRRIEERAELVALIGECGGNLAEVARRLDLSRGAVLYRARKHGLVAGPLRVGASRPAARSSCDPASACGASGAGDA